MTIGLGLWYAFCLPQTLFKEPVSLILTSREGHLLGARIAKDGQWRFPYNPTVPEKFKACIVAFEDKRFDSHIGVDFLALARAIKLNLTKKDVVSGGSTLTMQTIRLSRKGQSRTYLEKIIEICLATRLEIRDHKSQILSYYASYAPFGGNVVGLDAAAWKYYGCSPEHLTWSETATLAVLPNAPGLIHLNRNRATLHKKRDFLLNKLKNQGTITEEEYLLALIEPLPQKSKNLPNITPHLTDRLMTDTKYLNTKKQIQTTINYQLQRQVNRQMSLYSKQLQQNEIYNAGIIVLDIKTNHVLAYCGNTPYSNKSRQNAVDMIVAKRSTGSILKPFLYGLALEDGIILQESLLTDVPSYYAGFSPKNYDRNYQGVVKASEALSRSLNVPIVKLLHDYGYQRFHHKMKQLGMKTLTKDAQHYGLSMILGGAETSLWDISAMYSGLVRSVEDYNIHHFYNPKGFESPHIILDSTRTYTYNEKENIVSASSAFYTLEAMKEVKRPGVLAAWKNFSSSKKIAWKTGTSFGNRDAWAIGCTKDYVVAVWVGNADGEGRPEMTGTFTASPLLFKVFDLLPRADSWFKKPTSNMEKTVVCSHSGYLASDECPKTTASLCGLHARHSEVCDFCTTVHTDKNSSYRVKSDCYSPLDMVSKNMFVLPPTEEYYFAKSHPSYQKLPEWLPNCAAVANSKAMEFVYPQLKSNIYLPITLDGTQGKVVFEIKHRAPKTLVYWYLDNEFIGTTTDYHEMELKPKPGKHTITLTDEMGERQSRNFKVVEKI